jgi:hypothetical protein
VAEQANIIGATRDYLLTIPDLAPLLDTRIFAVELPAAQSKPMPRKALVIRPAGGLGSDGYLAAAALRFDFHCYGETPYEADRVRRAAHGAIKQMHRKTHLSIILHSATQSGGPTFFREQDTNWPVSLESWLVFAAETLAA